MKTAEQHRARELRALGWSIGEIEKELCVARSSVSVWVRHVQLSPEARDRLVEHTRLGPVVAAERKSARARELRRSFQDEGRARMRGAPADYVAGCMLYWAEGAKARNTVAIVNSDVELLIAFVRFLRKHFRVAPERFTVTCNLFADHAARQQEIEQWWVDKLELPSTSVRQSHVNVYSKYSHKKRTNKLPHGTCSVRVHSSRIVQTIYGSIQEYGGFDRPE